MTIRIKFAEQSEWFRFRYLSHHEIYCRYKGGELHVLFREVWKSRHLQLAKLIADAIERLGASSLPGFYVNLGDRPSLKRPRLFRTRFSACSAQGSADVAAPDFTFEGWPQSRFEDYDSKAAAISEASRVAARNHRAFWTGPCVNDQRKALVELAQRHHGIIEALATDRAGDAGEISPGRSMSIEQQVAAYRYLIDVEGTGYSARLKLLLHARRVVLVQMHPWREWFYDGMQPFRHFVPVARDFSDLVERVDWLLSNPVQGEEIAWEGQDFARTHLTRAAAVTVWTRLLQDHVAADGNLKSPLRHEPPPRDHMRRQPSV